MSECIRERNGEWHIAKGRGDSWFRPILCGQTGEGINLPGPSFEREPTCPSCFKAAQERMRGKKAA